MAPPGMKITWEDIINGIFPTKEMIEKQQQQHNVMNSILEDFIVAHASEIPTEMLEKSDVRDSKRVAEIILRKRNS